MFVWCQFRLLTSYSNRYGKRQIFVCMEQKNLMGCNPAQRDPRNRHTAMLILCFISLAFLFRLLRLTLRISQKINYEATFHIRLETKQEPFDLSTDSPFRNVPSGSVSLYVPLELQNLLPFPVFYTLQDAKENGIGVCFFFFFSFFLFFYFL